MGRYADAVTQILLEQGRARAQGQLASGQAWGQMAQQLGQIPGQVIAQQQQLQESQQKIASAKAQEADRLAQAAKDAEALKDRQTLRVQDAALRDYFANLGDAPVDHKAVMGIVGPERGVKIAEGFTAMRKLQRDDETAGQQEVHKVMLGFSALDDAQRADAWPGTRATLIRKGFMQPEDAPEAYDPAWYQQRVQYGVEQAKVGTREIKVRNADGTETIQIIKDVPTATPFTSAAPAITAEQQAANARADAAAAETARHNRATEAAAARTAAAAQGDKTELTPEGLDAAATLFAKTGQLPALGMGDKTTRKAIINRAAALIPGLDVASAKADFGANTASLKTMQTQRDAIRAFEGTAAKNIDLFLETAGKVADTGSPIANTAVRLVSGQMLGSPDQAAYDAARQVAVNEIAKITQGGGLSGVLSDSARKEIGAFNPQNATLKQTVAVMRLLKQDMANRASSMDDQIQAITARIGKGVTPPAPVAAPVSTSGAPKEGDTKPLDASGAEATYRNGRWIRTK